MTPRRGSPTRCGGLALVMLLSVLWGERASAHYLDIAQLSLYPGDDPMKFRLQVTLPLTLDPSLPVSLPPACTPVRRDHVRLDTAWRVTMAVACAADAAGHLQTRWGRDGATLRIHAPGGGDGLVLRTLAGASPGVRLPLPDPSRALNAGDAVGPGLAATAMHYLSMGAVHVLIGWDHLAFVFCLTLLARGLSLIALVTAFTLGHSLSLGLAHLGFLHIPIAPVEAIIALSIVFMARDAWLRHRDGAAGDALAVRKRLLVTGCFGLIHGLGFASVLGDLGVSASERIIALAFFNIGVEAGQVAFVLAVLFAGWGLRQLRLETGVLRGATAAVGGLGVFWAVERVLLVAGAAG